MAVTIVRAINAKRKREEIEDYVIRAFLSRGSHGGILLTAGFCGNVSERIKKTNGFRTDCARLLYAAIETKPSSTHEEVVSRVLYVYSRDTRGAEEAISITDVILLPAIITALSRTHYRRSRHMCLRNGVSIRRALPVIMILVTSSSCLPVCQTIRKLVTASHTHVRTEYVNMSQFSCSFERISRIRLNPFANRERGRQE